MVQNSYRDSLNFLQTLKPKYTGPIFDSHVHLGSLDDTREMVSIAKEFNIKGILGISREAIKSYQKSLTNTFSFARYLSIFDLITGDKEDLLSRVRAAAKEGCSTIKLWYAPRLYDYVESTQKEQVHSFRLNESSKQFFFKGIAKEGLNLLFHVSDPDLFYDLKYQPESKYGSKDRHLSEFEGVVKNNPDLTIIGAHMAGQPEHLDHLATWLEKYDNLYLDTASARWMARSFHQQKQARKFFIRFSQRILYGTDVVAGRKDREPLPAYYYNRYYSYRALFESSLVEHPLPIPDPENNNETVITGLDLPLDVLKNIYWNNAQELFCGE
jgi:hypothetical protein